MKSHIFEVKLASLLAVGGAALWIGSAGAAPLFSPAVSKDAGQVLRDRIRNIRMSNKSVSIEELAKLINPVIRGWFNYFSKFAAGTAKRILTYVNLTVARWTKSKYKSMKGSTLRAMRFLKRIAQCNPNLFYHWQIGLLPAIG